MCSVASTANLQSANGVAEGAADALVVALAVEDDGEEEEEALGG